MGLAEMIRPGVCARLSLRHRGHTYSLYVSYPAMPATPSHSSSTARWQFSQVLRTRTGVGEKVINDIACSGRWPN